MTPVQLALCSTVGLSLNMTGVKGTQARIFLRIIPNKTSNTVPTKQRFTISVIITAIKQARSQIIIASTFFNHLDNNTPTLSSNISTYLVSIF